MSSDRPGVWLSSALVATQRADATASIANGVSQRKPDCRTSVGQNVVSRPTHHRAFRP